MTGTEIALIITAVGTSTAAFVTSVGGVFISLRNGRKLEAVHSATNGKMNELLDLTAKSSKAEGVLQGEANGKERKP